MKTTDNSKKPLSPKQEQVLALLKNGGLRRLNILEGSVRSGKTYVSLLLWAFWIAVRPDSCVYLMAGKTLAALKRNVLAPLEELFGGEEVSCSLSKKEAKIFGRTVYLEGACDVRSETKIRGLTLDGAYCDELSLFPEDFFVMLLSRLSRPGAKLFATTNPDHPRHWLKQNYLDNEELDLLDLKFTLDDNIFHEKEYVEALKAEFKGVYRDRFILGLWVAVEGRIYKEFGRDNIIGEKELAQRLKQSPIVFKTVGVDYGGNRSASVFCLVGFDKGFRNVYVLDEVYDDKNDSAEALISSFAGTVERWSEDKKLLAVYCDSAEQLLVKSFRRVVRTEVKNALKKPISTRINMLCRLISAKRFFVSEKCPHLIEALETALWDESRTGCDMRLDNGTTNIDSLDALEYAMERYEKELFNI